MLEIWFWQQIVSPHMAGLADGLVRAGCSITYVAQKALSPDRKAMGWTEVHDHNFRLCIANSKSEVLDLARRAPTSSIHICQGIRANGAVSIAQVELARRHIQQWVVMETVEDTGIAGISKRLVYDTVFAAKGRSLSGVLAIGHGTPDWIADRGFPRAKIFPFTYFLAEHDVSLCPQLQPKQRFRLIFVGQLIRRKRVDVLIEQLVRINASDVDLIIIGDGPERCRLLQLSEQNFPGRVSWMGPLDRRSVLREIAKSDCLVLPSRHDGWGAVISEALMAGTPVICSDACGAADVVRRSHMGGVFPCNKPNELGSLIVKQIKAGPISSESRRGIANWAGALGSEAGAKYLLEILDYNSKLNARRPVPPWQQSN